MDQVSVRELRNQTSGVLRRVEAGERVLITVDRRPVAELVPLARHDRWVAHDRAVATLTQADPALGDQLREVFPETTDVL